MTIISIRYLHPVDKILGNNQNGESVHISTKEFHINTNFLKGIFSHLPGTLYISCIWIFISAHDICIIFFFKLLYRIICELHISIDNYMYSIYTFVSAVITLVDQQLNNLLELMLDGAELTDKSIHHIARCAKLNKLQISFCEGLTDQALKYIQVIRDHDCLCEVILGTYIYTCQTMTPGTNK